MSIHFPYMFRHRSPHNAGHVGGLIFVGSGADGVPGPALATEGDVRAYLEANGEHPPDLKGMTKSKKKKLVAANTVTIAAFQNGRPPLARLEAVARSLEITRDHSRLATCVLLGHPFS